MFCCQEQCSLEKTIVALKAENRHLQEKVDVCPSLIICILMFIQNI